MSEEAKPTNDPCAVCGRPVDSHTPNEGTNCRANRPNSLIPKPTVESKPDVPAPEEKPKTETTTTSTDDQDKSTDDLGKVNT